MTYILTKRIPPHKTDIKAQHAATHAAQQHPCITQASPGQQKQRDLQAEPSLLGPKDKKVHSPNYAEQSSFWDHFPQDLIGPQKIVP